MRQFADMVGISNPYLSQIERGLRDPSEKVLDAIARSLDVSADALYAQAGGAEDAEEAEEPAARVAIREDPHLSPRQRQALLEVYDSFLAARGMPRRRRRRSRRELGRGDRASPARRRRGGTATRRGAACAGPGALVDAGQDRRPVLAQRLVAHEEPEVPAGGHAPDHVAGGRGDRSPRREDLVGRGDVVGGAGQQVQRAGDAAEVDPLAADLQRAADERVVAEQALDDPQVEGARDVLGVLEPVLEVRGSARGGARRGGRRAAGAAWRPRSRA